MNDVIARLRVCTVNSGYQPGHIPRCDGHCGSAGQLQNRHPAFDIAAGTSQYQCVGMNLLYECGSCGE